MRLGFELRVRTEGPPACHDKVHVPGSPRIKDTPTWKIWKPIANCCFLQSAARKETDRLRYPQMPMTYALASALSVIGADYLKDGLKNSNTLKRWGPLIFTKHREPVHCSVDSPLFMLLRSFLGMAARHTAGKPGMVSMLFAVSVHERQSRWMLQVEEVGFLWSSQAEVISINVETAKT